MDRLQITHYGPRALLSPVRQQIDRVSLARCRGLLRCLDECNRGFARYYAGLLRAPAGIWHRPPSRGAKRQVT